MNDQAVVEWIVEPYFRRLPHAGVRHVVDVGAAYGSVASVFLRAGWTADLLEPDPACRAPLAHLTAAYPTTCRVFSVAAGGEDRESIPFVQNSTPGLSGFANSPFGAFKDVLNVRCTRLDSLLASNDVKRVDFLKIDTEGHDFDVLETHDYERLPPVLVFAEYSYYFPRQKPADVSAAVAAMEARGYRPVIFEYDDEGNFQRGSWTHRLVAIHFEARRTPTRERSFGNVLFYRDGDSALFDILAEVLVGVRT